MDEAVILAGGLGTRLRDVVPSLPKPMAPIRGRPFLSYQLDYLAAQGIRRVVLSVGYCWEALRDHFGDHYHAIQLDYAVEPEPLGTGGGMRLALAQATRDPVFVLNGDTFFPVELRTLAAFHEAKGADVSLALAFMRDARRYGTVELDSNQRIVGFTEKSAREQGLINGGVYVLRRGLLEDQAPRQAFSFEKDVLEPRCHSLRCFGLVSSAYFIDIGVPADYQRAQTELE